MCHSDWVLLLGLWADPRAAAAAQKVPRLASLRYVCCQLLPGGWSRWGLHPCHSGQPAAPLPHRRGGAGLGAPLRNGGEWTLPSRVWSDQPVPATPSVHTIIATIGWLEGEGLNFLPVLAPHPQSLAAHFGLGMDSLAEPLTGASFPRWLTCFQLWKELSLVGHPSRGFSLGIDLQSNPLFLGGVFFVCFLVPCIVM